MVKKSKGANYFLFREETHFKDTKEEKQKNGKGYTKQAWCNKPLTLGYGSRSKWISMSSKSDWSTEQVPKQPRLHSKTLSKE